MQQITFSRSHNADFYKTLQQRVKQYFKDNNTSRHANTNMVLKTFFMLALYCVPFVGLFFFESTLMLTLCWSMMGFGMAGVGLSVMHDANHGAYSKHASVNKLLGITLNMLGGNNVNWRIQHNVLHHTYTNVTGMDEDINPGKILRFTPHAERYAIHRFQHWYAWFFYGFMTLLWCTTKDYRQAFRYKKMDLTKTQHISFTRLMTNIVISKIFYFSIVLVLPLLFSGLPWWGTILSFLWMHFIGGLVLALIFQPAHVVPSSNYPIPDDSGNIEADWAVSQLYNTANFAPGARLFSWYVGGLNFQIEHHLFPNICHVHYRNIAPIVADTAREFNLPYFSQRTFGAALREHTRMLKDLGRNDLAPAIH